jgi:hypothetical protein
LITITSVYRYGGKNGDQIAGQLVGFLKPWVFGKGAPADCQSSQRGKAAQGKAFRLALSPYGQCVIAVTDQRDGLRVPLLQSS